MRKNQDRKQAEDRFLKDRGRVTNKELAKILGIHPATVARWKRLDDWELKLMQSFRQDPVTSGKEDSEFDADLRHLNQLNDRLDLYLQKRELLPSEILELAQAKLAIMSCFEIINNRTGFIGPDFFDDDDAIE